MDDGKIAAWKFGAIVGGVVALLILLVVLVIGITLLRRYIHNKQRKRHYSQHIEDGPTPAGNEDTSLSQVTFGVLWSLQQPNDKHNQVSSHFSKAAHTSARPHAFAVSSNGQKIKSEGTITVAEVPRKECSRRASEGQTINSSLPTEAVYHELENPAQLETVQIPSSDPIRERHHSANSYTSISSDVQRLPPPPTFVPAHRRGRRHSLPNNLLPVNHNLVAIDNPNYINYRCGRRNSDPSVNVLPHPPLLTPGTASPAEYEKPLTSYMPLDFSTMINHSYTPLNLSDDPNVSPEIVSVFQRQPLSLRSMKHLRMNSIPEESNYEKLNPLPKPNI